MGNTPVLSYESVDPLYTHIKRNLSSWGRKGNAAHVTVVCKDGFNADVLLGERIETERYRALISEVDTGADVVITLEIEEKHHRTVSAPVMKIESEKKARRLSVA